MVGVNLRTTTKKRPESRWGSYLILTFRAVNLVAKALKPSIQLTKLRVSGLRYSSISLHFIEAHYIATLRGVVRD
jgi:hypothetical protein